MITVVVDAGAADSQAVPATPAGSDIQWVLWGFSAAETAGTAATAECVLRHGNGPTSPILVAPMNFAADGFGYPTFFPVPLPVPNGIYVDRVSGTTTIVLYVDKQ